MVNLKSGIGYWIDSKRLISPAHTAKCIFLFLLVAALLPPTALCEGDDSNGGSGGVGEVIPVQLTVNDRQIDDVVEELVRANQDVDNLRPLLGLHGALHMTMI